MPRYLLPLGALWACCIVGQLSVAHGQGMFVTPIGGVPYQDWTIVNYVDRDPTSGAADFLGGTYTYNGHNAIDYTIANFAQMDAGVSVLAAADGVVAAAHDGEFDRCSAENPCGNFPNYVVIDHGGGVVTEYLHLKKGSVAVNVGDPISAGQQIGQVGSSGMSTDAHLHFAVYENGVVVDTEDDPTRWWINPVTYSGNVTGALDFGVNDQASITFPELRERPVEKDVFDQSSGQRVTLWANLFGIEQGDQLDFLVRYPSGAEYYSGSGTLPEFRYGWWYNGVFLPNNPTLGTWEIEFRVNGASVALDTFLVADSSTTRDWQRLTSGNWDEPGSWNSSTAPHAETDVTIQPNDSLTVTGPAAAGAAKSLVIGGAAGSATLQLQAGGPLAVLGETSVAAGSVLVAAANFSTGSLVGQGNVALAGSQLTVGGDNADFTFNGPITGTGGVVKTGAGVGTLAGPNSYTGTTTIEQGTLTINNTLSSPGGEIQVADGATLRASGALQRHVGGQGTIEASGPLVLGDLGSSTGYDFPGTLLVGSHLVALLDADEAQLASGVLEGGTLATATSLRITGSLSAAGQSVVNGIVNNASIVKVAHASSTLTFTGPVTGSGSFSGEGLVIFQSSYSPGDSPAAVQLVNADFHDLLLLEIAGRTPGDEYDQLIITGNAAVGGTLAVELLDGFQPLPGDAFLLIDATAGSLIGQFSDVRLPALQAGLAWRVWQDNASLSVEVVPEPATWGLMALGGGIFLLLAGRRVPCLPGR